jgi:hypothetical protein
VQSRHGGVPQRGAEASLAGMAVDDEGPHGAIGPRTTRRTPRLP